ncbi:unnamed protein product, partial [Brenthis ino]
MSTEEIKRTAHIDSNNIDELKENGYKSVISCDSGLETFDASSSVYLVSSDSELSPIKSTENHLNPLELQDETSDSGAPENDVSSEISTPTSLSSEDKVDNNYLNFEESSVSISSKIECPTLEIESINKDSVDLQNINRLESQDIIDNKLDNLHILKTRNLNESALNSESGLRNSTFSLNEPNEQDNNISLSLHSRSVENLSYELKTNNTKELDKDQILSEFTNQKNKVSATQKIVPDVPQNLDVRYTRLPKELLSQDLGSIVKNVHGIFSTVSGSLKNVYNNSHRVAAPKPQIKNVKAISNGKIMNEIFDDIPEEKPCDPKPIVAEHSINITSEYVSKNNNKDTESDIDNPKNEMLKLQIESLERVLFEQRKENASLRERVKQQVDELQAKDQTFKELEAKVDLMCKRAEQAQKEKDAAVMRYASTECAAIEAKKAAEASSKAEKAAIVEKDLLAAKLKTAREEKQRICQLYDDKCHELQTSEREVAKVKEEYRELEGRLKWTQSKLRVEMEAYKESTERVEKLSQQVSELEAAREAAVVNAADTIRAKQLEIELKESQAALIMCRHEKDEFEKRLATALQQLDTCKRERDEAISSLTLSNEQVESLKQSNMRLEEEAAELAALRAQAALADTLSAQLQRETERAWTAERALSAERARAETCARREAAALQHAAALTAAHVGERARAARLHDQAQALTADNTSLRENLDVLQKDAEKLKMALEEETERRNKENKVLARKVAELTEEAAEANKKLEWEKGENSVLKKKHASALKELNRELQRAFKRIEQLEAKVPQNDSPSIRTGSISSLSSTDSPQEERVQNGHSPDTLPDVQTRSPECDRQALVERVVALQRAAAARAERCEFLQEHCAALTRELRGKARLLRALLPALPPAALAAADADRHKSEIAQMGGGAMAALWGGDPGGMTLDLSLEMNKRLQAVLEDTLLKNITLKENMDTLGEEISRLREQMKANDNK